MRFLSVILIIILVHLTLVYSKNTVYFFLEAYGNVFAQPSRDNLYMPFIQLRQALSQMNYESKYIRGKHLLELNLDPTDFIVFFDLPSYHCYNSNKPEQKYLDKLQTLPKDHMVLFISEPPTVKPYTYDKQYHQFFKRVYTLHDDLVDFQHYLKFFETMALFDFYGDEVPFNKRKLAVLLSGNKTSRHPLELYSQRCAVINFFIKNAPKKFDYYGQGWDNTECYKGFATSKMKVLKQYKFCFCYENMRDWSGYITGEKIFYPMICGTIPVYWGPQNITDYIPADCFIDRRNFKSDQAVYEYLCSIDEEQYNQYITNIKHYLASEQAQLFSTEYFVFTVLTALFDYDQIKNYYHQKQLEKFKRLDIVYYNIHQKRILKPT